MTPDDLDAGTPDPDGDPDSDPDRFAAEGDVHMGDLFDDLQELKETVDTPEERDRVEEAMRTAA